MVGRIAFVILFFIAGCARSESDEMNRGADSDAFYFYATSGQNHAAEIRDTIRSLSAQIRRGSLSLRDAETSFDTWHADYQIAHQNDVDRQRTDDSLKSLHALEGVELRTYQEREWERCVRRVVARVRDQGGSESEQSLAGTIECSDLSPGFQEALEQDRLGY